MLITCFVGILPKSLIDSSIENNISILKDASIGINEDTFIVPPRKWVKGYYKKMVHM